MRTSLHASHFCYSAIAIAVVYRSVVKERDPKRDFLVYVMGWISEVVS
jgi:hypothetical protein